MSNVMENEIHIFTPDEIARTREYWSDERMAQAIPVNILRPAPPGKVLSSETIEPLPVKQADVTAEPFRSGGKVSYCMSGTDKYGSAQFCGHKRLVLTAAHCVRSHETREWAYNLCFQRAYNGGSSAKKFYVKAIAVKAGWTDSTPFYPYDYAFLILDEESDTETLSFRTEDTSSKVTAIGYPSNLGGGKYMQQCDNCIKETATDEGSGIVRLLGTPMLKGCSGGAWLDEKTVVGLNSYSYGGQPNIMYGPLFDENFQSLYNYALENININMESR